MKGFNTKIHKTSILKQIPIIFICVISILLNIKMGKNMFNESNKPKQIGVSPFSFISRDQIPFYKYLYQNL